MFKKRQKRAWRKLLQSELICRDYIKGGVVVSSPKLADSFNIPKLKEHLAKLGVEWVELEQEVENNLPIETSLAMEYDARWLALGALNSRLIATSPERFVAALQHVYIEPQRYTKVEAQAEQIHKELLEILGDDNEP